MAEAIFMHKVKQMKLEKEFMADSAGTASYHIGSHPDDRTMRVLEEEGIEYIHHARAFKKEDFEHFDIIVPMDHKNYENIVSIGNGIKTDKLIFPGGAFTKEDSVEIPDPYYGGMDDFYEVYSLLNHRLDILLNQLLS